MKVIEGDRVIRKVVMLVEMLNMLSDRQVVTMTQLERRFRVSKRTIQRDIELLKEMGFPVKGHPPKSGGYAMDSGRWSFISVNPNALERLGYGVEERGRSLLSRVLSLN